MFDYRFFNILAYIKYRWKDGTIDGGGYKWIGIHAWIQMIDRYRCRWTQMNIDEWTWMIDIEFRY